MSDEVPFDGLLVGLFREDIDAQLNSWEKACTTGEWMHGAKLSPTPFPENARQLIIETNYRIDGICDLVFSYETLVSQWSDLVAVILQSAGWRVLPICMATIKQAAASRSNPWRLDAGER